MPKSEIIEICSHKRSGTHFLAASIWKNFVLPDCSLTAGVHAGKRFVYGGKEWKVGGRAKIPWGGLWRSHGFYNPPWFEHPERVLYIVRDPVDTLMSYWRLMDPLCEKDPDIYLGVARVKFWIRHARGYTKHCNWVKYEDLVGDKHDEVLDQIGEWFQLEKKGSRYTRMVERFGWYSGEDPVQSREPTEEMLDVFRKTIPKGFLGYEIGEKDV